MPFEIGKGVKPVEPPTRVWLETNGSSVTFYAAKGGVQSTILQLASDGTLNRFGRVAVVFGFKLDHEGRVELGAE